ncbi:hypothetical protein PYCCODRAFT_782605 [Trametes coccinea BRFM310]|uniref:Uncharacterized protein n=1 Tax=Trametes coccinea (strain BRFM310) TaxID=1353009 RepID=A0A1Y2J0K6_TRAC3|nr:hypothetical protein PYCCODRAFT_782605 [Trametes coccinea BRFM310]
MGSLLEVAFCGSGHPCRRRGPSHRLEPAVIPSSRPVLSTLDVYACFPAIFTTGQIHARAPSSSQSCRATHLRYRPASNHPARFLGAPGRLDNARCWGLWHLVARAPVRVSRAVLVCEAAVEWQLAPRTFAQLPSGRAHACDALRPHSTQAAITILAPHRIADDRGQRQKERPRQRRRGQLRARRHADTLTLTQNDPSPTFSTPLVPDAQHALTHTSPPPPGLASPLRMHTQSPTAFISARHTAHPRSHLHHALASLYYIPSHCRLRYCIHRPSIAVDITITFIPSVPSIRPSVVSSLVYCLDLRLRLISPLLAHTLCYSPARSLVVSPSEFSVPSPLSLYSVPALLSRVRPAARVAQAHATCTSVQGAPGPYTHTHTYLYIRSSLIPPFRLTHPPRAVLMTAVLCFIPLRALYVSTAVVVRLLGLRLILVSQYLSVHRSLCVRVRAAACAALGARALYVVFLCCSHAVRRMHVHIFIPVRLLASASVFLGTASSFRISCTRTLPCMYSPVGLALRDASQQIDLFNGIRKASMGGGGLHGDRRDAQ